MERKFLLTLMADIETLYNEYTPSEAKILRGIWDNIKSCLETDVPIMTATPEEQYERLIGFFTEAHRSWSGNLRDILLVKHYCSEKRDWEMTEAQNKQIATMILMDQTLKTWDAFNGK